MGKITSDGITLVVIVLLTLALVGIGIGFWSTARSGAGKASTETAKDVASLEEDRYTQYDGTTINGAELLALIERFETDNIAISVQTTPTTQAGLSSLTSTSTGTYWYIKSGLTAADKLTATDEAQKVRDAKNVVNPAYINPSGQFYAVLNRSADTGAIQGLSFFRVEG